MDEHYECLLGVVVVVVVVKVQFVWGSHLGF